MLVVAGRTGSRTKAVGTEEVSSSAGQTKSGRGALGAGLGAGQALRLRVVVVAVKRQTPASGLVKRPEVGSEAFGAQPIAYALVAVLRTLLASEGTVVLVVADRTAV